MATFPFVWKKFYSFLSFCLFLPVLVFPSWPNLLLPEISDSLENAGPSAIEYIGGLGGETYAVEAIENRLYLGQGNRLEIYDLGRPDILAPRGRLSLSGLVQDIYLSGNRAYLATGSAGLQIVDIADPDNPRLLGAYDTPGTTIGVCVEQDRAYLADSSSVQILDVSQPDQPKLLGSHPSPPNTTTISTKTIDVQVVGGIAYVIYLVSDGSHYATKLALIDVDDPSKPAALGSIDAGLAHRVQVVEGFVYLASSFSYGWDNTGLIVVDARDPAHPVKAGGYGCIGRDAFVQAGLAYLSCDDRLVILDVQNPAALKFVGSVPSTGLSDLAFAHSLVLGLTNLNVYGGQKNLLPIFDVTNPTEPSLAYQHFLSPPEHFLEIQKSPGRMYATWAPGEDRRQLDIYDLTDPSSPQAIGSYQDPCDVADVEAAGNYAYLAGLSCGLKILDVSNPAHPQLLATYKVPYAVPEINENVDVWKIAISGNFAFLAGYMRPQLEIVDIRNPSHPVHMGQIILPGTLYSLDVTGGFAYLIAFNGSESGLYVVDVRDPAKPKMLAFHPIPVSGLQMQANLAYTLSEGLLILDLTYPESPQTVSRYLITGGADHLSVQDGYAAILGNQSGTLYVLDVHDPQHPAVSARFELGNLGFQGIYWHDHFLYVSTYSGGLQILWFAPPTEAVISGEGGQLVSVYDGTAYTFPPGAFAAPVVITHFPRYAHRNVSGWIGTGRAFEVSGEAVAEGEISQPNLPYTLTIRYNPSGLGSDFEKSLAIYGWDGSRWVREPASQINLILNQVTAEPDHFGSFALLGDGYRLFFPMIGKMGPGK